MHMTIMSSVESNLGTMDKRTSHSELYKSCKTYSQDVTNIVQNNMQIAT